MAKETKIKEDTVTVPVAQGDLDAVSNAEFYNPHGVLGGHLGIGKHADTATIRVLRPLAKSVTILTQDGEYPMTHEYNGVFVTTVPASGTKKQPTIPDYRVRTEWESGAVLIEDDPYRYMPTVGDMDTYLFGEGRHEKLWEALGAHVLRYDDPMGGVDGTPGEQRSPCGPRTPMPCAWSVTSTPGMAVVMPCASSAPPACGRSSSPASARARPTSSRS